MRDPYGDGAVLYLDCGGYVTINMIKLHRNKYSSLSQHTQINTYKTGEIGVGLIGYLMSISMSISWLLYYTTLQLGKILSWGKVSEENTGSLCIISYNSM